MITFALRLSSEIRVGEYGEHHRLGNTVQLNIIEVNLFWVKSTVPTGGVSYTVGGAAAPPTLCFGTPTFVRFSGFQVLKRWCFTLVIPNCDICRHFGIQFLVFIP